MPIPQNKPSEVVAESGEVMIDGPDGIVSSMTPEAAARTSARLLKAAARARGQLSAAARDGEDRLA